MGLLVGRLRRAPAVLSRLRYARVRAGRRRLTRRRSTIVERVLDITVSERRCLVSGDVQHEPSALVTVWTILGKTPLPGAAQPLLWPDLVIRAAVDEHAVSEEQAG